MVFHDFQGCFESVSWKFQENFQGVSKKFHIAWHSSQIPEQKKGLFLARAVGVAVGRRSGGRLATTLVATKNVFIYLLFFFSFFIFSAVATFSHRRRARIKKLI